MLHNLCFCVEMDGWRDHVMFYCVTVAQSKDKRKAAVHRKTVWTMAGIVHVKIVYLNWQYKNE